MGLASCIAGCFIVLINIIFLIVGLVFTAVGVVIKFGAPWISSTLQGFLGNALKAIEDNLPAGQKIDITGILNNVFQLASSIAIILLVLGVFFLILSITGMCGVCCSSKTLLMIFCIITGAIFIAVFAIAMWVNQSNDALVTLIKSPLDAMIKKYKGAGSFEVNTLVIDLLNLFFGCCGINNGSDFNDVNWNKKLNYTINGEHKSIELVYPVSCCKVDSSKKPIDANCTFEPTLNNSNYNMGCWEKITGDYLGYFNYLTFGLFGLCGFFAILLTLGLLVICCDKSNKVDSV